MMIQCAPQLALRIGFGIWDMRYEVMYVETIDIILINNISALKVAGRKWQSYTVNGQVGGYLTKWKNTRFAFATVHGAGHEVPTYKPDVAFYLWENYLNGVLTNE
jgi:hypothetical protein